MEISSKLKGDLVWSFLSFAVLAASGLLVNIFITSNRGAVALGIFNITYSIYIVASQFASLGIHYSVIHYSARHQNTSFASRRILGSSIFLALLLGFFASMLLWNMNSFLSAAFKQETLTQTIRYASLGLIVFPCNKVLMGHLNAIREMKAFSICQISRFSSVTISVALFLFFGAPTSYTTISFFISEIIVLIIAIRFVDLHSPIRSLRVNLDWIRRHLTFGLKGMASGLFAEVNTRVDVLIIGLLISTEASGIYSFISMISDGIYHILAILRLNINPIIAQVTRSSDLSKLIDIRLRSQLPAFLLVAGSSCASFVLYYYYAHNFSPELLLGLPAFLVLLSGLLVFAPVIIFDNSLIVSGFPAQQTLQIFFSFSVNIFIGIVLTPSLGLLGAAVGTISSYAASTLALEYFGRSSVHWSVLYNHKVR